jgi:hypothetical protein
MKVDRRCEKSALYKVEIRQKQPASLYAFHVLKTEIW